MVNKIKSTSIKKHFQIKEIKNDVVVLKNKGLRSILITTSLNFSLKSVEEQDAVIYRYQEFLNSLDFSIQILAVSRKFNINPYIQSLTERKNKQENELLRIQTAEYIDFIKGLTEMNNIMTESFYLVIPYSPSIIRKKGIIGQVTGIFKKESEESKEESFQELKNDLWQRVEFVATGLRGIGIKSVPLNTNELIELFYKLYNPNAKEGPEIEKANQLRIQ